MKVNIEGRVPKLRFPEFREEWHSSAISEYAKTISSGRSRTVSESGGEYSIYGSTGQIGLSKKADYSGDKILIARVGANAGTIYRVSGKYAVSDNTLIVELNDELEIVFAFYLLKKADLNRLVFGSGQPLVTGGLLKKLKIAVPEKAEQQKIADFLTAVDERIGALQKKIDLLKNYKKGVMQAIFSQKLRFKDENGHPFPDWEEKRLGELGKTYNGLTGKTAEDFGEGFPFVTYKQIFDNPLIDTTQFALVKIRANEKQNNAAKDDVFFTTSSETPLEVGFASVLLNDIANLYLNSFCFGYRINSQQIFSTEFAQFLFRSASFRRLVVKLAQGSTRFNMSKNELMKITIKLPVIEEQKKIADLLTVLDNKIKLEESKLEQAKRFKKALLQQMFV